MIALHVWTAEYPVGFGVRDTTTVDLMSAKP